MLFTPRIDRFYQLIQIIKCVQRILIGEIITHDEEQIACPLISGLHLFDVLYELGSSSLSILQF